MKVINFIPAALIICALTQCQPEQTAGGGWAGGIEGYYINSLGEEVTVNRIDDTHVSITATTVSTFAIGFTNVTMNSATTFTLNNSTISGCPNNMVVNGTGTASNNNISLFLHAAGTPTGSQDDCTDFDHTVSAAKQ